MTARERVGPGLAKLLRRLGYLIVAGVIVGILVREMSILDRLMVYFPEHGLVTTPAEVGIDYQDVYLTTADGVRIHAWYIPGRSSTTMLWLHGNAGNMGHRVPNLTLLNQLTGIGVFIIDYRGYGLSDGRPSEQGLYADAEAAFDYLVSEAGLDPVRDVVLFGRSLGVGAAAELATRHTVRCVILESGFTSVRDIAKATSPSWLAAAAMPFLDARFDTLSKMDRIRSPVMIVHGDRDEVVPTQMAEQLYDAARDPKRIYIVKGAQHNDTYEAGGQAYFDALQEFIANSSAGPSPSA